jgi:ABC-type Fe3+/spermidine/putrescine transport system ATPase subunit/sugar lactone lactonase YvrE
MAEWLWQLDGVRLSGAGFRRLDGVSLRVSSGVTAVLGCSGAGKTSMLNLLVGFETPDGGAVLRNLPAEGFHLPLYWVPQDGGLWPHLTVWQHLEAVTPRDGAGAELLALLDAFDILGRASSYPHELSRGECSRLAVARALAAEAAVLVMDEPLAHVDEARVGRYWDVIMDHVRRTGASLVFATHSSKAVLGTAERVICLKEGRVLCEGKVDELYWNPATEEQAQCLGEVNWLEGDEARLWTGDGRAERRCYRPEQISIEPSAQGRFIVRSCRFRGSVAEVELAHQEADKVRRFYHRPSGSRLRPGDRVMLKALVALLAVLIVGCGGAKEPVLTVKETRCWQMPADGASIPGPRGVAVGPQGEVFVVDTAGRVLVFDADGTLRRQWRMPETDAGKPEGICALRDGRVAVSDTHYHRIVLFDGNGRILGMFGRSGTGPGEFIYPVAVTEDDGGNLYVAEYGSNDRVQKFTSQGELVLSFGTFGTGPGQFQRPSGVVWREGRLYVADAMNNRIQIFSDAGQYLGVVSWPGQALSLRFPYGVACGTDGCLYVIEYGAGRLSKVTPDGRLRGRYGSVGRGEGQFLTPWGLAADPAMRILVADTGNRRIVELRL